MSLGARRAARRVAVLSSTALFCGLCYILTGGEAPGDPANSAAFGEAGDALARQEGGRPRDESSVPPPHSLPKIDAAREAGARRISNEYWPRHARMREWFDTTYRAAMNGDGEAMLELDDILLICAPFAVIERSTDYASWFGSSVEITVGEAPFTYYEDFAHYQFDDCKHVLAHVPEGLDTQTWGHRLHHDALESGSPLARLVVDDLLRQRQACASSPHCAIPETASSYVPEGAVRMAESERLLALDAALRTEHPDALEWLGLFTWKNPDPQLDEFLDYARCAVDAYCDVEYWLVHPDHGGQFYAHEIELFERALKRLHARMRDPRRLPLEAMKLEPLLRADGTFSFEDA